MRRLPVLACAPAALVLCLALPAAASAADPPTGGASAPGDGTVSYGQPTRKAKRFTTAREARPLVREFSVAPAAVVEGSPVTFAYRVRGRTPKVRVRIVLRRGGRVIRLRLGYQRTGVRHAYGWTPSSLPAGDYAAALQAFDGAGRALRRTTRAPGRTRLTIQAPPPPVLVPTTTGVFPVAGPYSFGGPDARFGAGRPGHIHQGQDITAAQGTPVVAPVPGTVYWIAFQAGGAGHYVVERGADGIDYVFMHLVTGSITVKKGAALAPGQPFAQVGMTGVASGPHLHFEIWPDGWYSSKASQPVDPLPQLQAWAAG
jgi:murein DD-endopeptidase MepM/ murein hydrolase activator NlpD